jgi:hypothetical protein
MYSAVSFYISPHPDDWQLFYGHKAYEDALKPSTKIVFIYTTAGDAGRADGWWEAREQAALASVSCITSSQHVADTSVVLINHHWITKHTLANSVSYCMRLPDGLPHGTGSETWHGQSLHRLHRNNQPITAVDQSTTYTTWQDFCNTIDHILTLEHDEGIPQECCWIHAPEYLSNLNPDDHADHLASADAIHTIATIRYNCAWWLTYYTYYCPDNLSATELYRKRATFVSYYEKIEEITAGADLPIVINELEWACWGNKAYSRTTLWNQPELKKPSSHHNCPQPSQFAITQINARKTKYIRCTTTDEVYSEQNLIITNKLTQKSIALNPVAEILWGLLSQAHSLYDLVSILDRANPNEPRKKHQEAVEQLLTTLQGAKIIIGV